MSADFSNSVCSITELNKVVIRSS